jgi:hypothetical protein
MRDSKSDVTKIDLATTAVADRRGFLKFAGAGVVTGSASVLGAAAVVAKPAEATTAEAGYRETEHIRRYYDSAR